MYYIVRFNENVLKYLNIVSKKIYWKIKYGKRIKIGKNFKFRKGMTINMAKNGKLIIGDNCFFNNYCSINCHKSIKVGDDNMFGENVKIYDHNHIFNDKGIDMKHSFQCNEITIGNNNWFGSNIVLLSKCNIGNYNVLGAGCIINEKIENEQLVTGSSALNKKKIIYK